MLFVEYAKYSTSFFTSHIFFVPLPSITRQKVVFFSKHYK